MKKEEMVSIIKEYITKEKYSEGDCCTCICNRNIEPSAMIRGSTCLKRFFTILCTLYGKKAYEVFEKIKQDYSMNLNMNCKNREILIYVLKNIKNNFDLE